MVLSQTLKDGVLIITTEANRIDAASAIHLKDQFRELTEAHSGRVLMDLSNVNFMDSSGLGAMVAALKSLNGRKLELCALEPMVAKVFKLTRMDQIFVIHATQSEAFDATEKGTDAA